MYLHNITLYYCNCIVETNKSSIRTAVISNSRNTRLRRPSGSLPPSAAVKEIKIGVAAAPPNDFKNFTRAMRIPNMCLVLKLD